MNRARGYVVLLAALLMQTCLGHIYAWSVFAGPLKDGYGLTSMQSGLIFGTCIFIFTFSLLVTGRMQDHFGPRRLAVASGLLLSASYLLAGLGGGHFLSLWLGVGVLGGLAIGCGYVCPVATAVKWFPRHKGLVAGIAVAGYGGAAVLLQNGAGWLFSHGWGVLRIFQLVGAVYGLVVVVCGLLMFLPEKVQVHTLPPFRRASLLGDRTFWLMFVALAVASFSGLTIIPHLCRIGESFALDKAAAAAAISILAAGNAAGRVSWGLVYDRFGLRAALAGLMVLVAVAAGLMGLTFHSVSWFWISAALVGFAYGANFAVFAPETARVWGAALLGTVYPMVLLGHGIVAQIGPALAGELEGLLGSVAPVIYAGGALALIGAIIPIRLMRSRCMTVAART